MKSLNHIIYFITLGILLSCNSQKTNPAHSHDGSESHAHTVENPKDIQSGYFGSYALENESYKTKTVVSIKGYTRTMVTNALPNHETGSFPNEGNPNTISTQNRIYSFPVTPKYIGKAQWVREPGVALNGIKFEPGTAEVVVCETGENYRVEALQELIDLGLDFNHAHVQPTGAYHYHGTPTSVIKEFDTGKDLVHIGFAHDGFPMYYSKSGRYKPSFKAVEGVREGEDCTYENLHQSIDISVGGHHDGTFTSDFEYVEGSGDLDECNGITIDGKYMYLVTIEFPYISRCLMGEVVSEEKQQIESQGKGRSPSRNRSGQRPSSIEIIKQMDANNDGKLSKSEVKGPLEQDFLA
ncbi:MAG: YHYH protein [Psychroserpens sp.]|uniref:YHYH protein n=1 Tax=Psychroserpens sp. TaxID=2020870 RepID=UPI003CC327A7